MHTRNTPKMPLPTLAEQPTFSCVPQSTPNQWLTNCARANRRSRNLFNFDFKVVARDGIEPPTPAFQGRLAMELTGLGSADIIETISVVHSSN